MSWSLSVLILILVVVNERGEQATVLCCGHSEASRHLLVPVPSEKRGKIRSPKSESIHSRSKLSKAAAVIGAERVSVYMQSHIYKSVDL